jgi:hypothetical protein
VIEKKKVEFGLNRYLKQTFFERIDDHHKLSKQSKEQKTHFSSKIIT